MTENSVLMHIPGTAISAGLPELHLNREEHSVSKCGLRPSVDSRSFLAGVFKLSKII
jgi:hypothetical protein